MSPSLRGKGASVLGELPRGAHVCIYYESIDDLIDAVVPFFRIGLEKNELCVWVPSKLLALEESRMALGRRIPNFDRHLAAGHMEMFTGREWYLKGDQFDLIRCMGMWRDKLSAALDKGYTGMRASGDASWINPDQWTNFHQYEYELNKLLKGKPVGVLCTYPLMMSRATEVLEVAGAHRPALARRNGDWGLVETAPTAPRDRSPMPKIEFLTGKLLSERERDVINLMAQGNSDKEIARSLAISPETVKTYVRRIFVKLNAYKRTQAVALAQSLGIVNTY
jgi:DNA-binding CsgD family transcriptional regulator